MLAKRWTLDVRFQPMKMINGLLISAALVAGCGNPDESMIAPTEGSVVHYEINGDLVLRTGNVVVWHATDQSDESLMRAEYVFAGGEGGDIGSGLDFKSKTWCDKTTERSVSGFGIIAIEFNSASTTIGMDEIAGIANTSSDDHSAICDDLILSVGE